MRCASFGPKFSRIMQSCSVLFNLPSVHKGTESCSVQLQMPGPDRTQWCQVELDVRWMHITPSGVQFGSLCQGSDRNYLCFVRLMMPGNHIAPVVHVSAHHARTHQAPIASSWFQFVPKNVKKHEARADNLFGPRVLSKQEAPTDACSPKSAPSRLQVSKQSGPRVGPSVGPRARSPSRHQTETPPPIMHNGPSECRVVAFLSRRDVYV